MKKENKHLKHLTNVSLDPNSNNYISKVIGDQKQTVKTDGTTKYLQLTGSFTNKSRFVRVESVNNTVDYLDENGDVRVDSLSLPNLGSGSSNGGFSGGSDGHSGFDALGNQTGDRSAGHLLICMKT